MYLLVEDPEALDSLGNLVDKDPGLVEETQPKTNQPELKLISSICTPRVLIDDPTKALYMKEDVDTECFYLRDYPPEYSLTEEKTLYVFMNTLSEAFCSIVFLDKFGLEWEMKLDKEISGMTFLGVPVSRIGHVNTSTSSFTFWTPMGLPMPTPSAPYPMPRPATSWPRVSFVDERAPLGWTSAPRPIGSSPMHAMGGHSATRVPTGLPHTLFHPPTASTSTKTIE